jgi:hypothetical protein
MSETTPDEAAEAERLRQLRAHIEELLREFDACAVVYLAGKRGRFETFTAVRSSWSAVHLVDTPQGPGLRVRSTLTDYAGDLERQRAELEWSIGMVSGFAQMMGANSLAWLGAAAALDQKTGATHTPWRRDDPRDKGGRHG